MNDNNPYDFVSQYRKALASQVKKQKKLKKSKEHNNIQEGFLETTVSRPRGRPRLNNRMVNETVTSTAISSESVGNRPRGRPRLNNEVVNETVTSTAISSESVGNRPRGRPRLNNEVVNEPGTSTAISSESFGNRSQDHLRSNNEVVNEPGTSTGISPESNRNRSLVDLRLTSVSPVFFTGAARMASNSENTNSNIQNTQNTAETPQMLRVLGPTIVIGDFYDGYDMSYLPPRSKRSKKEEVMFIPPDECTLEELNRTINVKVYWRETSTSTFPIRMFQSIESIFEHFVKIEQINITHITLTLHGKILRPTDTPRSINYKISDFIDGKIDFYQSSISDPSKNNEAKEEKLEDDEIKIYIMQKDVRKRIFFTIKKNEKMIILYIKVSEKLGLDIEQFTLLLDGDNIKWNDTVKTLDLEGDECVQLDEKDEK